MKKQLGFTLLEVLVSIFIFSVGILGIAALQITTLKNIQQNYQYSIAQVQLTSMMERLLVNTNHHAQIRELDDWNRENQKLLPDGKGQFHCDHDICHINLVWREHHLKMQMIYK